MKMREAQRRVEAGVVADDGQSVVQELDGVIDRVLPPAPPFLPCAQIALVRVQVGDGTFGEPPFFVGAELELERVDDDAGESFLEREDVLDGPVVLVGPQVVVRGGVDELSGNAQAAARPPHAAFEDVSDAELTRDRLHILGRLLERHRRTPGDDAERPHFGGIGGHFVGEPAGEVRVLRVGAQVREWQHGDRLHVPERGHGAGSGGGAGRRAPFVGLPPGVDFGFVHVDAAEDAMHVAVHGRTFFAFPPAHGPYAAVLVRGNFLPRVEAIVG
jgi:hypothetical protein